MSELKRCPICNGKVVFDIFFDDYTETLGEFITCRHCDLIFYGSMDGMTKEQLTEEWNTRKPMQNIVERLEEEKTSCFDWEDEIKCVEQRCYRIAIEIVKEEGGV